LDTVCLRTAIIQDAEKRSTGVSRMCAATNSHTVETKGAVSISVQNTNDSTENAGDAQTGNRRSSRRQITRIGCGTNSQTRVGNSGETKTQKKLRK
jgi:hypothetical protein